jgi:hypothetical protein
MKYTLSLLLCLLTGLSVESCVNHDIGAVTVDCTGYNVVSFNDDIKDKIIAVKCAIPGCHNGDLGPDRDWTNFSKFQEHAQEAKRRLTLSPFAHDKMPRTGSLTYEQIKTIVCWVEQGAKDN